jgi:hypothetical protein
LDGGSPGSEAQRAVIGPDGTPVQQDLCVGPPEVHGAQIAGDLAIITDLDSTSTAIALTSGPKSITATKPLPLLR